MVSDPPVYQISIVEAQGRVKPKGPRLPEADEIGYNDHHLQFDNRMFHGKSKPDKES